MHQGLNAGAGNNEYPVLLWGLRLGRRRGDTTGESGDLWRNEMLTRKTTPYFPINRDDETDWYEVGFRDAQEGRGPQPPEGKLRKRDSYLAGYYAGKAET